MKKPRNTRYTLQLTDNNGIKLISPMLSLNVVKYKKDWIEISDPYLIKDIWDSSIGNKLARESQNWRVFVHKLDRYWRNEEDLNELKDELLSKIESDGVNIYKIYQGIKFDDLNIYEVIDKVSKGLDYTIDVNLHDNELIYTKKVLTKHKFDDFSVKELKAFCKENDIDTKGKKSLIISRIEGKNFEPINIFEYLNDID